MKLCQRISMKMSNLLAFSSFSTTTKIQSSPTYMVFFASLLFSVFSTAPAFPTDIEDLRKGAAYLSAVNQLVAKVADLTNQTIEYDNLAGAVAEGKINSEFAQTQLRSLSARLRREHVKLQSQIDQLPPPPPDIRHKNISQSIKYARRTLDELFSFLKLAIVDGEKIVDAALRGDDDILAKISERQLKAYLANVNRQIGTLQMEALNQKKGSISYYLYNFLSEYYQTMIIPIKYQIQTLESPKISEEISMVDVRHSAMSHIDKAHNFVRNSERAYRKMKLELDRTSGRGGKHSHNLDVLSRMLTSFPETFSISNKMLGILERHIDQLVSQNFEISDERLNDTVLKLSALEARFNELFIQRQKIVQEMR